MLRYKTETRHGLVALYDIRPGNGAGPFLQPRSPHRAVKRELNELVMRVLYDDHAAGENRMTPLQLLYKVNRRDDCHLSARLVYAIHRVHVHTGRLQVEWFTVNRLAVLLNSAAAQRSNGN